MKTHLLIGWVALTLLNIVASVRTSQQHTVSATIVGQVQDARGRPVAKARVEAHSNGAWVGLLPVAYADVQGRFSIHIWAPTTYRLYASKEEQFYATTSSTFYDVDHVVAPEVTVNDNELINAGIVLVNSQAGKLVAQISDAETGRGISASVEFRREDDPNAWLMTASSLEGQLVLLVPAVPFRIEVKALGYADWFFGGDGTKEQAFSLYVESKTIKELTISLNRNRNGK